MRCIAWRFVKQFPVLLWLVWVVGTNLLFQSVSRCHLSLRSPFCRPRPTRLLLYLSCHVQTARRFGSWASSAAHEQERHNGTHTGSPRDKARGPRVAPTSCCQCHCDARPPTTTHDLTGPSGPSPTVPPPSPPPPPPPRSRRVLALHGRLDNAASYSGLAPLLGGRWVPRGSRRAPRARQVRLVCRRPLLHHQARGGPAADD